ncbi:lycopene cyclase family protein [Chitinophaga jiangningensis]|uniref:lycopene cyclase family protein n=1 Tax=Chitinophaga jiangningensis TaxID=1419482 RepID=UPI001FE78F0C|nr:lycopene cyclase family protein [Chitinophaga jiangningensis]
MLEQRNQRLLIIDSSFEHLVNKTWCFWEKETGIFDHLVHCRWDHVNVIHQGQKLTMDIRPYRYKMIRSMDFYDYTSFLFDASPQVHYFTGHVTSLTSDGQLATVIADGKPFYTTCLFNSIPGTIMQQPKKFNYLLQHFKGWTISTTEALFDPLQATLMDFSVAQEDGTAFIYLLPTSETTALVEYTEFSTQRLSDSEYERRLIAYITGRLGISEFAILEEESGAIPMTDHPFSAGNKNIINIGTTGGATKASSGYTFSFIQSQSLKIAAALRDDKLPTDTLQPGRFGFYDAILLDVLSSNKTIGADIFFRLFKCSPPERVLRFLDNKSSLLDEGRIFLRLPKTVFTKSLINKIRRSFIH